MGQEAIPRSKVEYARGAILELIASDPSGEWNVIQICENIYGHFDHNKGEVVRRALRTMRLPGTWRVGWRNSRSFSLHDPYSDAVLADLQKRIEHLEKRGWHESAKACAQQLKRLRALKAHLRYATMRRFIV